MIKRVLIFFLFAIAVIGGLAYAWMEGYLIPNQPSKTEYPVRGIDVSHHNGEIDWAKVAAAGYQFAWIKASEGSDWQDKRFIENWSGAGKNGILRGAYHFFSTTSPGETQARNFINIVPAMDNTLPPVIDIEFSKAHSSMTEEEFFTELAVMIKILTEHYQTRPVIYTTEEFHTNYLAEYEIPVLWAREVIWKPKNWAKDWTFWQYSGRGRVNGVSGRVDLNVYRYSIDELTKL